MGWAEIASFAVAIAAAGVVSGLLAGIFGIGGGAVLVPVFYQVFGLLGVDESVRMHVSVGSSLAIIIPTSMRSFTGASGARRGRHGAAEDRFLIPVPVGVVLASLVAAYISSEGLRIIFAVLALLSALRLLFNRESWRLGTRDARQSMAQPSSACLIGFFSTLMGIGGGIMNNTFMTLYGRPMHQAVATSSGVGVLIAIPGTIGYIWAGWGNPLLPFASTGYINWIAVGADHPDRADRHALRRQNRALADKRQLEIGFGLFCLFVSARFFVSLVYDQSRRISRSPRTSKPDSVPMKFMPSRLWSSGPSLGHQERHVAARDGADADVVGDDPRRTGVAVGGRDRDGEAQRVGIEAGARAHRRPSARCWSRRCRPMRRPALPLTARRASKWPSWRFCSVTVVRPSASVTDSGLPGTSPPLTRLATSCSS